MDTEIIFLFLFFWQWQCICDQQETLRVKDDELHQLLQDIRARDSTINEIAENNNRSNIRVNERSKEYLSKSYVINQSTDNIIKIKLPTN